MKKRIFSALLVFCLACSLVGTAWAAGEQVVTLTPSSESQTLEEKPAAGKSETNAAGAGDMEEDNLGSSGDEPVSNNELKENGKVDDSNVSGDEINPGSVEDDALSDGAAGVSENDAAGAGDTEEGNLGSSGDESAIDNELKENIEVDDGNVSGDETNPGSVGDDALSDGATGADENSGTPEENGEEQNQSTNIQVQNALLAPNGADGVSTQADLNPDENFITVSKRFEGLKEDEIPGNFSITVTPQVGAQEEYKLTKDDEKHYFNSTTESDGDTVWTWRIDNVGEGSYNVEEENAEIEGFTCVSSGIGECVNVKAAQVTIQGEVISSKDNPTYTVGVSGNNNFVFAAAVKDSGVVVLSKDPLPLSVRGSLITYIPTLSQGGNNWRQNITFYSFEDQTHATVAGVDFTYNPQDGTVTFSDQSAWTHVASLYYEASAGTNPDINITNTYTPTTTTLTLTKTFDGLSDAEVQYLMFERSGVNNNRSDANFGFDINYCQTNTRDGKNGDTYLVDDQALGDLKLPDGTLLKDTNLGGGAFYILAGKYLNNTQLTTYPEINDDPVYVKGYTDSATGASLKKNKEGNWVYSITLTVPKTDEKHFFTVFEQHQEMPGYAKINDSNAEYTITGPGYEEINNSGTGKFMDIGCTTHNIYEDMVEICGTGSDSTVYNGMKYNEEEDVCIAADAFQRIQIIGETTIAFTNHYTGKLDVTKKIGDGNDYADASTKKYTLTIAPAHLWKLDFEKDATESTQVGNVNHGLNGKYVSYYIDTANGGRVDEDGNTLGNGAYATKKLEANGSFTISITPDQIIHFVDMPAIQWQVTEDETKATVEGYTLGVDYSDSNNGVVNDVTHWNEYKSTDTIGGTDATDVNNGNGDGIASVDSAQWDVDDKNVDADAVALVTVTNTYKRNFVTLTVNKTVAGSMGDTTNHSEFTFYLTLSKDGEENPTELSYTVDGTQQPPMAYDRTNRRYTFTLSHDETAEITIPYGYTASLQEVEGNGYVVYSRLRNETDADITDTLTDKNLDATLTEKRFDNINTISSIEMNQDQECDFYNFRPVVPPTGLESNHTAPYTLIVTAAGLAGLALIGAVVSRRLRRRREE